MTASRLIGDFHLEKNTRRGPKRPSKQAKLYVGYLTFAAFDALDRIAGYLPAADLAPRR